MKKILIVKTSSLGDVIHCFQAVSQLQKLKPEAELHWLVNNSFCEIVSLHPAVKRVIPFNRQRLSKIGHFFPEFLNLRKSLRAQNYDLAIDFQGLFRNSFFAWISGAKKVIGFDPSPEAISGVFYHLSIKTGRLHAIEKNCELVAKLFGEPFSVPPFEFKKDIEAEKSLKILLRNYKLAPEKDPYIVVAPRGRWESKNWPPSFFITVLQKVKKSFPLLNFVIAGAKEDEGICEKIADTINTRAFNLAGKTNLRQLFELIRYSKLMFCVDSGPMHIAAALRIPVCALFGPTDPEKTGPYGTNNRVFQSGTCIKCFKRYCFRSTDTCHSAVNPDEVAEHLIKTIGEK